MIKSKKRNLSQSEEQIDPLAIAQLRSLWHSATFCTLYFYFYFFNICQVPDKWKVVFTFVDQCFHTAFLHHLPLEIYSKGETERRIHEQRGRSEHESERTGGEERETVWEREREREKRISSSQDFIWLFDRLVEFKMQQGPVMWQ